MQSSPTRSPLHEHVIRTLLYYDIFTYPLKCDEIFSFLGVNSITEKDVRDTLNELEAAGLIFKVQEFYSVHPDEKIVLRRIKGNIEANNCAELARKRANLIASFPFVRGVLASGSFSKGYMDVNSDLDFFIITAPGKLWIARTLLVLYKKIFLLNNSKFFCVNYFVDEAHLEIEEQNSFTATELATLKPLYGDQQYKDLILANRWLNEFYPNFKPRSVEQVPASNARGFKGLLEKLFSALFPRQLDSLFRTLTLRRWLKLYGKDYSRADFEIAFKSKNYASKNHPRHFQRKVMELYAEKLKLYGISINTPAAYKKSAQTSPV